MIGNNDRCAVEARFTFLHGQEKRPGFLALFLMPAVALIPLSVYGASFDCAKSFTKIEKMICADDELSQLDSEIDTNYKKALITSKNVSKIKSSQQQWLTIDRNNCSDSACIKAAYEKRIRELRLSPASDIKPTISTIYYHFTLTNGAGTPVCDAYLKRLNGTNYTTPPYCDRPEETRLLNFDVLHRVPQTAEAAHNLFPRVNHFVSSGKQGTKEEDEIAEARARKLGISPPIDPIPALAKDLQEGRMKVWRYDPPIDIDNDGVSDNVLVWQGYGVSGMYSVCGVPQSETLYDRQAQIAFILTDSNDSIDVQKTKEIFEHPSGGYRLPNGVLADKFRPLGQDIGIFNYKGLYYIDTFFDDWGDFNNNRVNDPEMINTLGVFLRRNGKTMQIYEYHMTEFMEDEGNK